ncbi:MAG TPA: helix-turn-helix transcriptional regulator [Candidatus Binataceae bacterium]|nr:helix-turn-helix transcriptional regulator [Candidatus Binataceae bacterium]
MKTFGQVIVAARKAASLTQKAVAARLRRGDGREVPPPYLNDLGHDRRYPPENEVIEQLAKILNISEDFLYFYARRMPGDINRDFDESRIKAAYRGFRNELKRPGRGAKPNADIGAV